MPLDPLPLPLPFPLPFALDDALLASGAVSAFAGSVFFGSSVAFL
jgi:hypothetical protein